MAIKKISLLLALLTALFVKTQAQEMNNYADNWKKVDGFDRKGLTASALKEVLIIYLTLST